MNFLEKVGVMINDQAEVNYNDNSVLDDLTLKLQERKLGAIKALIFTVVAIFVFFVPISFNGSTDVSFGHIYKTIEKVLGLVGVWGYTLYNLALG